MATTIINLTPHAVTIVNGDNAVVFESKGVARAKQEDTIVGTVNGINVVETRFGEPEGLPDPVPGTMFVVSLATANAAMESGRSVDDLLLTSNPVRDQDGRIIGCTRFARIHQKWHPVNDATITPPIGEWCDITVKAVRGNNRRVTEALYDEKGWYLPLYLDGDPENPVSGKSYFPVELVVAWKPMEVVPPYMG